MPTVQYILHYGGTFESFEASKKAVYKGGSSMTFTMDPDYVSYFELKDYIDEHLKFKNIFNIYYLGKDGRLASICSDQEVIEFNKQAIDKGHGVLYVHHSVDTPTFVDRESDNIASPKNATTPAVVVIEDEKSERKEVETEDEASDISGFVGFNRGDSEEEPEYDYDRDDLDVSDNELAEVRKKVMEMKDKSDINDPILSFANLVGESTIETGVPSQEAVPSDIGVLTHQGVTSKTKLPSHQGVSTETGVPSQQGMPTQQAGVPVQPTEMPSEQQFEVPEYVTWDMEADLSDDPNSDSSSEEDDDWQRKKKTKFPRFNPNTDLCNVQFQVGMEFENAKDFKVALREYAIQQKKDIYMHKNESHYVIEIRDLIDWKHK